MNLLGKATCRECKGTKTLVVKGQGFWSKCLDCGFQEWEWEFGDNPEYLEHLAKEYSVTVEDLKNALKNAIKLPTTRQKTILEQLLTLNPNFYNAYGVKAIIWHDDGRTVRIHTKNKRTIIYIDITYDEGADLYNMKAYKLKNITYKVGDFKVRIPDIEEIFSLDSLLWGDLDKTIRQIIYEHAKLQNYY